MGYWSKTSAIIKKIKQIKKRSDEKRKEAKWQVMTNQKTFKVSREKKEERDLCKKLIMANIILANFL